MLNQLDDTDVVFHALSDPTRRRIVEQLSLGPASVSALAAPLPMSMPAVVQHLQVLRTSGLVETEKVGRVRTCRLVVKRLDTVQDWIDARRTFWDRRLDRLGDFLAAEQGLGPRTAEPAPSKAEQLPSHAVQPRQEEQK